MILEEFLEKPEKEGFVHPGQAIAESDKIDNTTKNL